MYLLLLQRTLIKLAYGCCTKPSMTYKSAQKINFTHLLKLFLKKHYSIRYVDSGKIILYNFGMNINSPLKCCKFTLTFMMYSAWIVKLLAFSKVLQPVKKIKANVLLQLNLPNLLLRVTSLRTKF